MKHELTANRLQQALDRIGMTQQQLSEASGIKKESISQYINGHHKPSNLSSGAMSLALGVNPMWLMGYDVKMLDPIEGPSDAMSAEDERIISAFHASDEITKEMVKRILKIE